MTARHRDILIMLAAGAALAGAWAGLVYFFMGLGR